jgi:hypothetical protein
MVNLLVNKDAETHPTLTGECVIPAWVEEQLLGIAIGNRWPFATDAGANW